MVKGERFMEIRKANVINKGENYYLELSLRDVKVEISLTEDKPNDVKDVFNKLILELKAGEFQFELESEQGDLYSQISNEYLNQLNNELQVVYGELVAYKLVKTG